MAKKSGRNGNEIRPGPGRPKGAKNKFTTLKQSFLDAFEGIGGTDGLKKWAKKPLNRKDFYGMVTKLLPKEIDAKIGFDEEALSVIISALPPEIAEKVKQAMIALKG